MFILLIIIYRSPIFWLIPFFAVVFAESLSRWMGYCAAEAGVTVNGQSRGILPVLVFGAGTDYALLLVARYREELRRHEDKHEAMRWRCAAPGPAIVASGGTVIAALLCLTLAEVNGTAGLGPIGALGVACAMVAMLTLLPALLAIAGRRAFWPFIPHTPERRRTQTQRGRAAGAPGSGWCGLSGALAGVAVVAARALRGWAARASMRRRRDPRHLAAARRAGAARRVGSGSARSPCC